MAVKKERGAVAVSRQDTASYYDRFRNRLMFPIKDLHGHVVGFTARVLDETKDKMGKYINTPQTPIYDKSRIVFGLDKAKPEIRKQNLAVLVEGQMDCITSHEAGVTNVVASSGTALTQPQVALIKRFTENLALSFDADAAGENASLRGIDIAQAEGCNVKIVTIPGGKDPDECIRHNPLDWSDAISKAKPIMDYYFDRTLISLDPTKAEDKKAGAKFLLGKIARR
ncbi:toprim domain-containing protein [Candidatus Uhrbacteria bacterium]|nr:toprim domain-containing protein [Candidatus Uhrbacteria bacterium]